MLSFSDIQKLVKDNIERHTNSKNGWSEVLEQKGNVNYTIQLVQTYSSRTSCVSYEVMLQISRCSYYEINVCNSLKVCYTRFKRLFNLMNNGRDIGIYAAKLRRRSTN